MTSNEEREKSPKRHKGYRAVVFKKGNARKTAVASHGIEILLKGWSKEAEGNVDHLSDKEFKELVDKPDNYDIDKDGKLIKKKK